MHIFIIFNLYVQLEGSWVTRKSLIEYTYDEKIGCVTYELSNTSDNGLTMRIQAEGFPHSTINEVRFDLFVVGDNKGRWKNVGVTEAMCKCKKLNVVSDFQRLLCAMVGLIFQKIVVLCNF